jgi:hypothetical protein
MCQIHDPSYYFGIFFTSALLTYFLYIAVYKYLSVFYANELNQIKLPIRSDKHKYAAKNIAKGMLLCGICIVGVPTVLYPIFVYDDWCSHVMRMTAAVYGSIDLVGFLVVPNLKITTKIHHIVSTILIFSSFYIPFEQINISRLLAIYAILSTYAFSVNLYLGLRWLGVYNKLRVFAMYNYILCCAINWSLLFVTIYNHYMLNSLTVSYAIVLTLMLGLVYDDVDLITWLYNDKKK